MTQPHTTSRRRDSTRMCEGFRAALTQVVDHMALPDVYGALIAVRHLGVRTAGDHVAPAIWAEIVPPCDLGGIRAVSGSHPAQIRAGLATAPDPSGADR